MYVWYVCVCLKYESNIPTEAPWEEQVVLQVWGHQGLDRSDATDGGLSDIRMVATWIQSRCGPRLFAHNYVHRCTVCFALTLVFLVSVAAAVEFVWQPWQQGGGRQVGDVHSFQARRFGSLWSLEVLILDSKKGMCAPFPKRHWNLIPVMTDRSWHSRLHRSIIRHKLTTMLHIDATISVHWFTELASVIVQAMAMVEVAKRSKAKSYEKFMFFRWCFDVWQIWIDLTDFCGDFMGFLPLGAGGVLPRHFAIEIVMCQVVVASFLQVARCWFFAWRWWRS
jgi:hypothetical protein